MEENNVNTTNLDVARGANSSLNVVGSDWTVPIAPQLLNDLNELNFDENQIKDYAFHSQVVGHHAMQSAGTLSNKETLEKLFDEKGKILNGELLVSLSQVVTNLQNIIDISAEEDKVQLLKTKETLDGFLIQLTSDQNKSSIPNIVEAKVTQCIETLLTMSLNPHVTGSMAETLLSAHRTELSMVKNLLIEMKAEREQEFERYRDILGINKHIEDLASKPKQEDGLVFEDRVSEEIAIVSGVFSDSVIATGTESLGIGKSKKGDTLVQVNEGSYEQAKISIESKSGKFSLTGKESLSVQLQEAMTNHNSDLGLAVVDISKAPKSLKKKGYMRLDPNTHVIVVDNKNDNFEILGQMWGILRELAILERNRKTSGQEDNTIDSAAIILICEQAIVELTKLNAAKKNLRNSVAKGALDTAALIDLQQSEMVDSFRTIIREAKRGSVPNK